MRNILLLTGLSLFISCSQGYENNSDEAAKEEAQIIALREDKKIINEASALRSEIVRKITDPSSFAVKVSFAKKFLSQMPIQLPTKNKSENLKELESMHELLQTLELLSREIKFKRISPLKMKSEEEKAFYAIAISIHDTENSSLLNLVQNSFNPESTTELNLTDDSLVLLKELLKARVNILSALSIKEIEEARFTVKKSSRKMLKSIEDDNQEIDINLESALETALQTKRYLSSVGVVLKIDPKIKSQLKKIKLEKKIKLNEDESLKVQEINEMIEELTR